MCQMRSGVGPDGSGMDGWARDEVGVKKVRLELKSQQHANYLTSLPGLQQPQPLE